MYRKSLVFLLCVIFICACSQVDEVDEPAPVYVLEPDIFHIEYEDEALLFSYTSYDQRLWTLWNSENKYFVRVIDFNSFDPEIIHIDNLLNLPVAEFYYEHPIAGFTVSDDTISLLHYNDNSIVVMQRKLTGEVLFEIILDFNDRADDIHEVTSVISDSEGKLYISWKSAGDILQNFQSGVKVLSNTGEVLLNITGYYTITGLTFINGDRPFAIEEESALREIDIDKKSWGQTINLYSSYRSMHDAGNNTILLNDGTNIYKFSLQSKEITFLFNYREFGISGWINWIYLNDDSVINIGTTAGNIYIVRPEIMTQEELQEFSTKTKIVLALTIPTDPFVMEAISEFNKENDDYRIEIYEITAYNIHRFRTEVIIGQVPDIIFYNSSWDILRREVPPHRLATRNLLRDLYTFIDTDNELGREKFLPNVLEAVSENGSLYELPYKFWLKVAAASADVVGNGNGWTFNDMQLLLDAINFDGYLFHPNINSDFALNTMLDFMIDDFIDWDTGNVYFDSPEFIALLEIVKKYTPYSPTGETDFEGELTSQGRQLMMWHIFGAPNGLQYLDYYFENMVPIGFPVSDGVGNAIRYDSSFSVSATSNNPDIAWSFIRQFYTPGFYKKDPSLIPVHVDALKMWFLQKDLAVTIMLGDYFMEIEETTDYDIERIQMILESAVRVSGLDDDISLIISEETDAFFRDKKNVQDTVRIIQNKIQTLVWEESG